MVSEKIEKVLNTINEVLKSKKIDFMVVGSLALEASGIEIGREVHNIDIEIYDYDKIKEGIDLLCSIASGNKEGYNSCRAMCIGDVVLNIWFESKPTHTKFFEKNGIKYAGVMSVLSRKMSYKRVKDYQDLNIIVNKIISLGK